MFVLAKSLATLALTLVVAHGATSAASDPVRIAVLVDTSQAVQPYVQDLRTGLRSFISEMQGTHQIAVYEFGERSHVLADYTSDPVLLKAAVDRVFARPGSGAYVLDAIVEASRTLRFREGARPAIVVISTEGPEFSDRFHQTVLDEVRASGATLHSFVLTRRRAAPFSDAARERDLTLAKGTDVTGGHQEHLLTSMALSDKLKVLAAELKSQQ
jgi:hypothetical protein